jgi:AcrR family transcriptional regulator
VNGFERRRQQKKDSILGAAIELFKQYGYNKVTIAEIAKRASVSQVSIYNFFQSKENLRQEILKKYVKDSLLEIKDILTRHDSLKTKLEKILVLKISFFKSFFKYFFPKNIESGSLLEDNKTEEVIQELKNSTSDLIDEGKREGIFNDSISTQAIAIYLEIIQYYFLNNPSALAKFDNNPRLVSEIPALFMNAFMKSN